MSRAVVIYYSRADENYVSGDIKVLEKGNTEIAAEIISKAAKADCFKIEQAEPYAFSYNECIEQARIDQRENNRPEIINYPESIDEYDIVYLGYPNYWSTMPMAMFTLLEKFDFSGKTIKPFCTHEGSGMGNSIEDIKRLCPTAQIADGLALLGSGVSRAEDRIKEWI